MKKQVLGIVVFVITFLLGAFSEFRLLPCETSTPRQQDAITSYNSPYSYSEGPERVLPTQKIHQAKYEDTDAFIPWTATIGQIRYKWNGNDLRVEGLGKNVLKLFSNAARAEVRTLESQGGRCETSNYFIPLAVFGQFVSYSHETGLICGTVSGDWRYASISVSAARKPLNLKDIFSDEQILQAFLANSKIDYEVQKAVNSMRLIRAPINLKELTSFLTKRDYEIFDGFLVFDEEYLTDFAFHHLQDDTVAIWVSLSSTSTTGRAQREHVEIYLPNPLRLSDSLQRADSRQSGFLMKDSATEVGTAVATFESRF